MTSKAMTKREETLPERPVEGLEGFDESDLVIPRLKMVQPTSAEAHDGEASPGVLLCNLSGTAYESIKLVPLFLRKGRVLFREGDERPTCASDDNLKPSERIEAPLCSSCGECPEAQWRNGTPPPCQMVYSMFALNLDDAGSPFIIQLKGMSIKPTKRLISYFTLRKLSPFSVSCTLKPSKTKNSRGTFYVAEFSGMEIVEPRDKYRDKFLALRGYDVQRTYDAEEEATSLDGKPSSDPVDRVMAAQDATDSDDIPF